jgi:hypothetical protein
VRSPKYPDQRARPTDITDVGTNECRLHRADILEPEMMVAGRGGDVLGIIFRHGRAAQYFSRDFPVLRSTSPSPSDESSQYDTVVEWFWATLGRQGISRSHFTSSRYPPNHHLWDE